MAKMPFSFGMAGTWATVAVIEPATMNLNQAA
jgi:hypothetical protein